MSRQQADLTKRWQADCARKRRSGVFVDVIVRVTRGFRCRFSSCSFSSLSGRIGGGRDSLRVVLCSHYRSDQGRYVVSSATAFVIPKMSLEIVSTYISIHSYVL